jgi:hypothetical protein
MNKIQIILLTGTLLTFFYFLYSFINFSKTFNDKLDRNYKIYATLSLAVSFALFLIFLFFIIFYRKIYFKYSQLFEILRLV